MLLARNPLLAIVEYSPWVLVIENSDKKFAWHVVVFFGQLYIFMFLPLVSAFVMLSLLFPVDFPVHVTKFVVIFMIADCQIWQV